MGNKSAHKVPINKDHFMKVLHDKKCSIRKLGEAYSEIERTEKTIRRCLESGEMPPDLLDKIAKYLNVHPDYLAGVYHEKADRIEDVYFRQLQKSFLKPEKYPYILKAKSDIGYNEHFEQLLIMNDISLDLYNTLPAMERVYFRQQMVLAIYQVIAKFFSHDSLGNSTSEILSYYESMVDDFDPFSLFAELEGIGLSEVDLALEFTEEDNRDFERRMAEKHSTDE